MGTPIAIDGIVNKGIYSNSTPKIAFLLKEVNYPDMAEDWPYTDWLNEQSTSSQKDPYFHKTFSNIATWLACVENPNISYVDCEEYKNYSRLISQIAVININKGPGGSSSDWDTIKEYAIKNADSLRKQISEIAPDILICGGTYSFAKDDIFHSDTQQTLPCGANWFSFERTKVVEFVHPAWFSVHKKILFSYFKSMYNDLLNLS